MAKTSCHDFCLHQKSTQRLAPRSSLLLRVLYEHGAGVAAGRLVVALLSRGTCSPPAAWGHAAQTRPWDTSAGSQPEQMGGLQYGVDECSPRPAAPPGACRPPAPTASPWRGSWMWRKSSSLLDARSPSVAEHCINSSSRLPPPFHFCLLNTRSLPFSHSGANRASSLVRRGLSLTPQEAARGRVPTLPPAMEHPPAARILS